MACDTILNGKDLSPPGGGNLKDTDGHPPTKFLEVESVSDLLVRVYKSDGSWSSMTLPYLLKFVATHRLKIRYFEFKPNRWIDVTGSDYEILMNAQYILDNIVRSDTDSGWNDKRVASQPEDFNQQKLNL